MNLRKRVEALEAALSGKNMELRETLGRLDQVGDTAHFSRLLGFQGILSLFAERQLDICAWRRACKIDFEFRV